MLHLHPFAFCLVLMVAVASPGESFASGGDLRGEDCRGAQTSETGAGTAGSLPSGAKLRRDPELETVRFLRGGNLSREIETEPYFRSLQASNLFADLSLAFLGAYRDEFRLQRPEEEMVPVSVTEDDLGYKQVRLRQVYSGIPVYGAELMVQLNAASQVVLVQGKYIPTPVLLCTTPEITNADALRVAGENIHGTGSTCQNCEIELVIFGADRDPPRLAYRIDATISLSQGWTVFVDAQSGAVLERLPTVYHSN